MSISPLRETNVIEDHNVRKHFTLPVPTCTTPKRTLTPRSNRTSSSTNKNEVELVIDMQIATKAGCRFWLGAQGAIMTEDVVPAAAVLAIRRLTPHRESGRQLCPEAGPTW
eukprot:3890528-Pyramimonas_sp.AAC.1